MFYFFQNRTRAIVAALSTTLNYLIAFIITATYHIFETTLSLPGVALFNYIISGFGLFVVWKILPGKMDFKFHDWKLVQMQITNKANALLKKFQIQIFFKKIPFFFRNRKPHIRRY